MGEDRAEREREGGSEALLESEDERGELWRMESRGASETLALDSTLSMEKDEEGEVDADSEAMLAETERCERGGSIPSVSHTCLCCCQRW